MRFWLQIIDWEYPADGNRPPIELVELNERSNLMLLYMDIANGVVVEMRVESDMEEGLDFMRKLVQGAESARPLELTAEQKEAVWLYQDGDECYL